VRQGELWEHTSFTYMSKNLIMLGLCIIIYWRGRKPLWRPQIWQWWIKNIAHVFHKTSVVLYYLRIKNTGITMYICTNCEYRYKSNVISIDKSSAFIMGICKYIHNVPHNSLTCLMISTANIEIIRLHIKV